VRVLNGAGIAGLASSIGELLEGRGFEVVEVGNAELEDASVVLHPPGTRAAAELVADDVPGRPPVRETTDVTASPCCSAATRWRRDGRASARSS
jgi:hypothetical protein